MAGRSGGAWSVVPLLPFVLVAGGCRTAIVADPALWTVERATEVVSRVEALQFESIRDVMVTVPHGVARSLLLPGFPLHREFPCDETGFDDFYFFEIGWETNPREALERWGTYAVRRIRFQDIDRVVMDRKWYPAAVVTLFFGPWLYDVELELKDGRSLIIYQQAGLMLDIIPLWIYPTQLLHTIEADEYAQAIEFLRARAAGAGPADGDREP